MAKNDGTRKLNIPILLAGILFCFTAVSMHLVSGLYSRYTTSGEGSDSARVITFGELTISESGDFYEDNKLMIIPGVDLTKKVEVEFEGSEAATYAFVEITPTKWTTTDHKTFSIMSGNKVMMQWSVADGWTYLETSEGVYIYYRVLAPNTPLVGVDVIAENGKIAVDESITKSEIESMTDISIKLRATVVQSGGFENVKAAWDSIEAKEG